ncbi:hypothetical protein B0F90DRAFT_1718658 [Multifurca ochricompacta]|uniref:Uncharacterized protein n=1 Tax=Multifurca ochricompacta TaxID=376703 RepID=A0AAD4M4L6_9AGAM|nr:hypothetical protein B0F90DRAFT_1718658 [Multifurca ochricompacta]
MPSMLVLRNHVETMALLIQSRGTPSAGVSNWRWDRVRRAFVWLTHRTETPVQGHGKGSMRMDITNHWQKPLRHNLMSL